MVRKMKNNSRKIKITAHNELEAASALTLSAHGITLDQEDIQRLKFADDASGEIFHQRDVENMDDEDVHKLVMEVMNTTVSDTIKYILGKYGLPESVGYTIATRHMSYVENTQRGQ